MDITSLVETIGNNIVQFQPTIQGVVSAVLTTLFLRKNTNISEFEKMKAGKYSEALDDLLENGKITYFELYKCQNFLKIAKIADEYHQEKQEEESKFFDFDWFMRFFDTAGNVSSEKMQRLWAKILSNEIENVGSFSLRAIETLKNMNQHEASLFQQMAHFVLTDSSGIKFLLSTDNDLGVNVNEKYGLTKADIITLEECGILNSLRNDNRISLDSNPYDPINGTLYPVFPALLQEDKEQEKTEPMPCLIYFAGSYQKKEEFEKTADFQGFDDSGKSYIVRVRKAKCYQQALSELYQVFVYNKICWTTVNTGYLDRFYEVYTDGDTDANSLKIDFGSYEEDIQNDMLLLWNVEKFTFQCRKFMVPCIDEKYYEHELDLKNYDLDSGYMLGINEDVLKVRHEKDKIIMTSLKESFRDWEAYRFIGKIDTSSHGYTYEMLSNSRKSSFFQNYRERQESSLGSRTELFWMVQSFEHNGSVELEKCEVLETPPDSCLEGDMNPFLGNTVFPMETRKTLALYFTRKGQKKNFCEDMVRFFVSQIQLSVCEYKCVGILQDKGV